MRVVLCEDDLESSQSGREGGRVGNGEREEHSSGGETARNPGIE